MAQKPHRFAFIGLIVCFFPYDETSPVHGMSVYRTLFLFPDGFGNFLYESDLSPLLLFCQQVSFFRGCKTALRAEAQLVDGQIVRSFPDPFNDRLLVFNKNIIGERKIAHSDEGKPCAMLNLPMPFFSSSTVLRSCPSESSPFQYPSRPFLSSRFRPIRGKTRMYVCIACFFLLLKLKTAVKSVNGCPAGCFLTQKFVLQSVERSATAIPQRPLSAHG